jgi:sigma-B regulation protein RsbU (phosphoserine phosphatase)
MRKFSFLKALSFLVISCFFILAGNIAFPKGEEPFELTAEESEWLANHPAIRLAPAPNFPPLEFCNEEGQYLGIVSDYAALMEEKLGFSFEILCYGSWNDVIAATKDGEIDLWLEAMDTTERREYMQFSSPYIHLPSAIIVREGVSGELSLADLVGLRVVAPGGYASTQYVKDSGLDINLVAVPSIRNGLRRLHFGSADALIANEATASYYIEELGYTDLRFAGETGFVMRLSLAVRKDWPMLLQVLEKAQASLSDEERDRIYGNWVDLSGVTGAARIGALYFGLIPVVLVSILVVWLFVRDRRVSQATDSKLATLGRSWLVLLTTFAAIILVVSAAFWSQQLLRDRATRDVHNALHTVLDATGQAVTSWFEERGKEVRRWSELDSIRGASLELAEAIPMGRESLSRATAAFSAAIRPLLAGSDFQGVTVVGLHGELLAFLVAGTRTTWERDIEDAANLAVIPGIVEQVLSAPSLVTTTMPWRSSDNMFHSIGFWTVILDQQGAPAAILALHVDPRIDFSEMLQRGRIGISGETYAINQFAQLISESRFENDLVRIGLIEELGDSVLGIDIRDPGINLTKGFSAQFGHNEQPLTLMAQAAVSGTNGQNLEGYNDYRGVPVVGAWLWDSEYELGITTEMDVSEAYEFFQSYQQQLAIGTLLTIFLILFLTLIFIRSRMKMASINADLEAAYVIIKSHSERMQEELNVGRDIQMSMIPLTFPAFPDDKEFVVFAKLLPAREVGGDFYDFYFSDKDHFCVCIGDVSGKGVPAALFMAVTKTLIRSHTAGALSTANVIRRVNDEVSADNPSSMFVTVFMAIINLRTGSITCTSAGHNPPYIRRRNGELDCLDSRDGPVVGALADIEYGEQANQLHSGDQLILYTDGVTEALNSANELYAEARLVETLRASEGESPEKITNGIVAAVATFEEGNPQTDDITVLVFEYVGDNGANKDLHWEAKLSNDLAEIPKVIKSIHKFCHDLPVPVKPTRKLKIVLDEMLSNVISYGYTDDELHHIELKVDPVSEGIAVQIADDGIPFNPLEREEPDASLPMEERDIGGLGIHLVLQMVDEFSYERRDGQNILGLVLRFDEEENNGD